MLYVSLHMLSVQKWVISLEVVIVFRKEILSSLTRAGG